MPLIVRRKGEKWATINKNTGKVESYHTTKKAATAKARAVNINIYGRRKKK